MLKLFRTWLARRRCQHTWDQGVHINCGMGKMFQCRKCGKSSFV